MIVGSGWGRDGREIESNTSRHSMIKKKLGQEVDSWKWRRRKIQSNIKHRHREHN